MFKSRYTIAHIMPWTSVAGTEQATLRIAEGVEGPQFKSVAFCLDGSTPVSEMFAAAGFETAGYRAVEPSYRRPKAFLRASFQLARELRRRQVDLVHCADVLAAHYMAVAGRLAGLPVLCHVRNRFDVISRRDQSFLRPVNKFVFVSRDTWKHFAYKVPARRGTVVYDGIDTCGAYSHEAGQRVQSVRREFDIPSSAKIIGMVARVAPQKDYATLAKAAARVVAVDPNVRFLIVGDHSRGEVNPAHYREVRQMLAASNLTSYFVFTDFREDVPRMIDAMDVFVLSTHHEGLPLVLLEALAQAKPVAATAVDGIPEIILDQQTGLLHAHQDDAQLAAQILSLLKDEAQAARLGQAGREFVKTNFTRERFVRNMADQYREVLGLKRVVADGYVDGTINQYESN